MEDVPLLRLLNNYGEHGMKVGVRGREVGPLLRGQYASLVDLLPDLPTAAVAEPPGTERAPLRHCALRKFVADEFDLTRFGLPHGRQPPHRRVCARNLPGASSPPSLFSAPTTTRPPPV